VGIEIAAPQAAGLVNAQPSVGQRQQESPVAQRAQSAPFVSDRRLGGQGLNIIQHALNRLARELRQPLSGPASALADQQAHAGEVDAGQFLGGQVLEPSGDAGQVQPLAGWGVGLEARGEVRHPGDLGS